LEARAVIVLCFNAGSSSLKVAAYDGEKRIAQAQSDGGLEEALAKLHGHRLVHGGPLHHEPARLDAELISSLRSVVRFAPLHLPPALEAIEAAATRFPGLPQVACFDTHFHWQMPEHARRLPIPQHLHDEGVRRYGFHGLSYELIVSELAGKLAPRTVVAHLGNGASLAALRDGRCVDTTMAFTPASGIVMGTRAGDLDPGVALYLMEKGKSRAEIERMLERESGLFGLSGGVSDMRKLLELREHDPRARLAVEMFVLSCRKAIGAFAAVLGGLDLLVFTGGIGENAAPVRDEICAGLQHLSLKTVLVVPTDEDRIIARHTRALLAA
jgi:acetate kinase